MKTNEVLLAVKDSARTVKPCTLNQYHKIATGPDYHKYDFYVVDKFEFNELVKAAKAARLQAPGYFAFNRLFNDRKTRRYR